MAHMRVTITRSNPNEVCKEKFAEIAEHTNLSKMPEPAKPMNFFFQIRTLKAKQCYTTVWNRAANRK